MFQTLAVWFHDLDPFAIEFGDGFFIDGLRWYGLSYLFGFFLGYLIIRHITKCGRSPLQPQLVGDMVITLAISIVIGGRLGYALFYKPQLLITFSSTPPWWDLLAINKGGMASHGGMIGGIFGCWWYARKQNISWPHIMDLVAIGGPLGLFFGRVANFFNGELYGRACDPDFPLAVQFPQEMTNYDLTQLRDLQPAVQAAGLSGDAWLANLDQLANAGEALNFMPNQWRSIFENPLATDAQFTAAVQVNDVVGFLIGKTQQSGEAAMAVREALMQVITPRHASQLYEGVLEGVVLFAALAIVYFKPRKPGVVAGWFCIVYGLVRIAVEHYREPDEHLGYGLFDLTRGQWLSIGLLVGGIGLIAVMSRRAVQPLGGWMTGNNEANSKKDPSVA